MLPQGHGVRALLSGTKHRPLHTLASIILPCSPTLASESLFPRAQGHRLYSHVSSHRCLFLLSDTKENCACWARSVLRTQVTHYQLLRLWFLVAPPPLSLSFLARHRSTVAVTTLPKESVGAPSSALRPGPDAQLALALSGPMPPHNAQRCLFLWPPSHRWRNWGPG